MNNNNTNTSAPGGSKTMDRRMDLGLASRAVLGEVPQAFAAGGVAKIRLGQSSEASKMSPKSPKTRK